MIEILELPAQRTAAIRLTVPAAEIRTVMGPAMAELMQILAAQNITPAGPLSTHHFHVPTHTFDFEVYVPIDTPVTPTGRVVASTLPAARLARTLYEGPYEGLPAAWSHFVTEIEANGHRPAPELWECYLTPPPNPTTELNRPLL